MTVTARTTLLGLIGDPVSSSLSPLMQNAALAALGLDWAYVPLRVDAEVPGAVGTAVRGLAALSFRGANVTIPHKGAACAAVDRLTDVARRAGSVNTISVEDDGTIVGDSTDGLAVVDGLIAAAGAGALEGRAVVLGAGGSSRAVVEALARELALAGVVAATMDPGGRRVLVNCTPLGGSAHPTARPDVEIDEAVAVCDLAYRPDRAPTPLIALARGRGVPTVDGLEVLVRQGAASLERWTRMPAPLEAMRSALASI